MFDWWSKYYYSIGKMGKVQRGYSTTQTRLTVYTNELEKVFEK